ncbi:hypothetical protein BU23DRAFT_577243 [Bimuria novae-zelandiae CBS 107.79]|uniref:DUF3669 domain-containing protein n=1 Tax=Bimuria novae-zelandiae CBS 107.79 TaxID=1447943 RepID=A0A6A5VRK4_9PLEO|nr:hypothetical protein BU23DRAFT_577243 [Bimuria novae-zelandiae CBS 107.79]
MSENLSPYRCIGRGHCGSTDVIKREDGSPNRSVSNDRIMHTRILQSFPTAYPDWWRSRLPSFPPDTLPCRAYHTERIPPMPLPVRQTIITRYCPPQLQPFVRDNRDDEDCVLRVYHGRRKRVHESKFPRFCLRNYALCVDQMEELGRDTYQVARALAEALVYCHWKACVDAEDAEFVLAPSTFETSNKSVETPTIEAFGQEFVVWMVDFDRCGHMVDDEGGVEQAVQAFYRNDPYYPRPFAYGLTDEDEQLWEAFKARYLQVSGGLLGGGDVQLAEMFIGEVERGIEEEEDGARSRGLKISWAQRGRLRILM